ncbi:hypothetical protein Phi13:2_gp015 [Cellulophaga phage phi13:2]|uniref:Uncharacterized protein n=2 Tax=Baltivirus TaxID=2946816 RepID=S0A4C0_9CAUD|nr:hypothetical protein Phi13:2_gp015 [Cellulophaga phage phi13:2]AGO49625.1 hypothetical protein Phi13:2_gp015 [Cellulophaga phage phi13:2]
MRIFKFIHEDGEMDIVAAETELLATILLCEEQNIDISELRDSNVKEIKKCKWDEIYLADEEGSKFPTINNMDGKTLKDLIAEIDYGQYIAGTGN